MIGARFGHFLDGPLTPIIRKVGVSPNAITVAGFLITSIGAVVMASDLPTGGLVVLAGSLFDMLDGIVARINGKASEFGAFMDSVLDRFSDGFLFLSLAWHFGSTGNHTGVFISLATMLGAFVISYARARAEGLGTHCKTGLMERPERLALIIFAALTGFVMPVLWVLCILTYYTVFQRLYHVWKLMRPERAG